MTASPCNLVFTIFVVERRLRPGKAQPLIGALTAAEPDWVAAHADDIVGATPEAGITILLKLQGTGRDLVALGNRIAPLCRGDARFESYVTRFISDARLKQDLLEAFRAASN
jgi:hypothetical protein